MTYDYLIEIINVIILCMLLLWLSLDRMKMFRKKQLMRCMILTLIVVIAEIGCLLTDNTIPQNRGWSILFNCIGFGLTPLVLVGEADLYTENRGILQLWSYIPAAVNGIFVLLSPFLGCIFCVTENNEYLRGPYFNVYLCAFLFSIVYSALKKLQLVRTLPMVLSVKIIVSTAAVLLGGMYQVLHPQFHITWLGMAIYFSLVYSFLKELDGLLDHSTGLLNKNTFHMMMAQETTKGLKAKDAAVVVFDIDHFKQINDTWGHQKGDEYLQKVAKLLKQVFGNYHRIFRIGGDEFAVILSRAYEGEVVQYLAKLEQLIQKAQQKDEYFPNVSYGYAFVTRKCSMEDAVKMADARMYECKKQKVQIDLGKINIREIEPKDDLAMAKIIRDTLKKYNLDIPGTAYYDPELDHLSQYYSQKSQQRIYFVAESEEGEIIGGMGMESFSGFDSCGEIQKLYVSETFKRHGIGKKLLESVELHAKSNGIQKLYLETHSNLWEAVCFYENNGFYRIERPDEVVHSTMDLFYIKKLSF